MNTQMTQLDLFEDGEPCISMELTRNHVLSMLREGPDVVNEQHRKGKEPRSFEDTVRHAIRYWGEAAREFIPAEHWPTEND